MLIYMQGDHTETEISAVLEPYRSWLTTHRRPMTVKNRVYYAQRMLTWATESARNPWEISVEDLTEWILTIGSSPSTRKNAADGLRSLYRWAVATGRTNHNPAQDLPKITVPRGLPRPTPDAVLKRGLERCTRHVDVLMLLLGSYTGLRVAEIAAGHTNDIDGDRLRVVGKGGHVRYVPINMILKPVLDATPSGWFFPSSKNVTGHYKPASIGQRINDLLDPGWSAHTLRHRFGTEVYRNTPDLLALRDLLGHSDVSTTMVYAKVSSAILTSSVDALAPIIDMESHMRRYRDSKRSA